MGLYLFLSCLVHWLHQAHQSPACKNWAQDQGRLQSKVWTLQISCKCARDSHRLPSSAAHLHRALLRLQSSQSWSSSLCCTYPHSPGERLSLVLRCTGGTSLLDEGEGSHTEGEGSGAISGTGDARETQELEAATGGAATASNWSCVGLSIKHPPPLTGHTLRTRI